MNATGYAPLLFSPYDYRIHEDPYPTYARLRDEAPVYRNEEVDFWALSRYEDVAAAFRDSKHLSSANGVSLDPSAALHPLFCLTPVPCWWPATCGYGTGPTSAR